MNTSEIIREATLTKEQKDAREKKETEELTKQSIGRTANEVWQNQDRSRFLIESLEARFNQRLDYLLSLGQDPTADANFVKSTAASLSELKLAINTLKGEL